jgi:hypothetical protein
MGVEWLRYVPPRAAGKNESGRPGPHNQLTNVTPAKETDNGKFSRYHGPSRHTAIVRISGTFPPFDGAAHAGNLLAGTIACLSDLQHGLNQFAAGI